MIWFSAPMPRFASALLVTVAAALIWLRWDIWAPDLGAVWFGAKLFALGAFDHIYAAPPGFLGAEVPDPLWHDIAAQAGTPDGLLLPYVYPPLVAAVLSPIAGVIGPQAFFNGALVVMALCILLSVWAAHGTKAADSGLGPWGWTIATLVIGLPSMGFAFATAQLQPQIVVTTLVLLAFHAYARGSSLSAGLLLALAASIKLTPAFFWLIFVYDRDWKAALGTLLGGAALLGLSFALGGADLHLAFVDQLQRASETVIASPFSTSVDGVALSLWGWWQGSPLEPAPGASFAILSSPPALQAAMRAALILSALAVLRLSRDMPPGENIPLRLLALWSLLILFGPLGWVHYLIGPLFLLPHLWGLFPAVIATRMAIIVGIACSALLSFSNIWIVPGLHLSTAATFIALLGLVARLGLRGIGRGIG